MLAPEPPTLFTTMSSPPKTDDGRPDDGRGALLGGDVRDDAMRPSRARRCCNRLVERCLAARAEHDVCPLLDEPSRDRPADAPARAGDERDLPGQSELHVASLVGCRRRGSCWRATARRSGTASDDGRATPTRRSTTPDGSRRRHSPRSSTTTESLRCTPATSGGRARRRGSSRTGSGWTVTEEPALREIDVGSWSGLTREEVRERYPEGFARWLAGDIGHDGETREQLAEQGRRGGRADRPRPIRTSTFSSSPTAARSERSDATRPGIPASRSRTGRRSRSRSSRASSSSASPDPDFDAAWPETAKHQSKAHWCTTGGCP